MTPTDFKEAQTPQRKQFHAESAAALEEGERDEQALWDWVCQACLWCQRKGWEGTAWALDLGWATLREVVRVVAPTRIGQVVCKGWGLTEPVATACLEWAGVLLEGVAYLCIAAVFGIAGLSGIWA